MNIKKEPIFWALDLEMEQPSNEIISIGFAYEIHPTVYERKDYLITPSQPLSDFIQNLTGLKDDMFDWSKSREDCFMEFYADLNKFFVSGGDYLKPEHHPITWGQGDLHLLRQQMMSTCNQKIELPRRVVDVKQLLWFEKMIRGEYNSARMSLSTGLKEMGLSFVGSAHNSADDAYNTLLLFRKLLMKKKTLRNNIVNLSLSV